MEQLYLEINDITIYTKQDSPSDSYFYIWIKKDNKKTRISIFSVLNSLINSDILGDLKISLLKEIYKFCQTNDIWSDSRSIKDFNNRCNTFLHEEKTPDKTHLNCISLGDISLSISVFIKIFMLVVLIEQYVNRTDKDALNRIIAIAITFLPTETTTQSLLNDLWSLKDVLLILAASKAQSIKRIFSFDFSDISSERVINVILPNLTCKARELAVYRLNSAKVCLDLQGTSVNSACTSPSVDRKTRFLNTFIIIEYIIHEFYEKRKSFSQIEGQLHLVLDYLGREQMKAMVDDSIEL